jgi:hypothetical protein
MKNKFYYTLASASLFLNSSAVLAHTSDSGGGLLGGLLHIFTGEHLLTLALVGVVVAYYIKKRSDLNK